MWAISEGKSSLRVWGCQFLTGAGSYMEGVFQLFWRRGGGFQKLGLSPLFDLYCQPSNCHGALVSFCMLKCYYEHLLKLKVCWKLTQCPPWTHLVLISLCHVLRLCHSFKGCALLSSFQFYVQYLIFFQLNHSHQHPKALNSKRNPLSSHPTNYHSILYFPLFMVSQKSQLPTLVSISSMLRSCSNLAARFKHPFWKIEWAFSFLVFILPDISPVFGSVTPNLLL